MSYLAAADATALAAETQAQCLVALEQLDAIETAARTSILAASTAGQGYSADADYSPRAWLIIIWSPNRGVLAVAAVGVLCAFCCLVDALPGQCLRRRPVHVPLSLPIFVPRRGPDRSVWTCP